MKNVYNQLLFAIMGLKDYEDGSANLKLRKTLKPNICGLGSNFLYVTPLNKESVKCCEENLTTPQFKRVSCTCLKQQEKLQTGLPSAIRRIAYRTGTTFYSTITTEKQYRFFLWLEDVRRRNLAARQGSETKQKVHVLQQKGKITKVIKALLIWDIYYFYGAMLKDNYVIHLDHIK